MNHITVCNLERVSKATARKLYEQGRELTLVPCKANLNSPWMQGFVAQKDFPELVQNGMDNFSKLVNAFEYYNCNDAQLGKYAAFYKVVPNA